MQQENDANETQTRIRRGSTKENSKGMNYLFTVYCNGMVTDSVDKTRKLVRRSKDMGIDGALISSTNAFWDTRTSAN